MNASSCLNQFVEYLLNWPTKWGSVKSERERLCPRQYIGSDGKCVSSHTMMIDGKKTYQIGIPIHWGYRGIAEDKEKRST